ncbi:MAG: complex I subunit 4 family protein [Candidatus Micrarchaeaceae archaeon]
MFPIILLMLVIPIAAMCVILATKRVYSKTITLLSTSANMILTLAILASSLMSGSVNISEQYPYISSFGIYLSFRIDIISLILLIMSSVVLFATALSGNTEKENPKTAGALIMLFQLAAIGLFTSSNLFLFFIFWDIGVIALFLMINMLGAANRKSASINFLIYEIFASSMLLLGIILIYFYTPIHSFNISYIASNSSMIPANIQAIIFIILFVAFMVNMPLFPMHFWLPDAHTEASTQGSMLLSGILTKFGGFGMLLLFSMFTISSKFSIYIAALATFSAFYSVLLLMKQTDIKRIIAYSTIVEMGIIMVGISAANSFGTYGAAYAMLSHGLAIALMFLLVGILKHIFGERSINVLKGTVVNATSTTYAFLIGVLAMIGFPLTAGFIADVLLFIGSIQAFGAYGIIPMFALVLMGAFLYFVINKSMISSHEYSNTVDFTTLEQKIGYSLLIIFIFLYGILPFTILNLVKI